MLGGRLDWMVLESFPALVILRCFTCYIQASLFFTICIRHKVIHHEHAAMTEQPKSHSTNTVTHKRLGNILMIEIFICK